MGFLAAALPIISAAASVAGGVVAGEAQQKAADYNAQVARNNAITAQRNATVAMEMGEANAQRQGMQTSQQVGKAKAIFGAAGIDPLSGSAADVQSGIEGAGVTDVQTIKSNAARQAWGYQTQSVSDIAQSKLDVMQGESGMASSFLSGASSGLNDWLRFGNASTMNTGLATS